MLLLIRLSRTRRRDPVMQCEAPKPLSHHYARDAPDFNSEPGDLVLVAPTDTYVNQFPRMTIANNCDVI